MNQKLSELCQKIQNTINIETQNNNISKEVYISLLQQLELIVNKEVIIAENNITEVESEEYKYDWN